MREYDVAMALRALSVRVDKLSSALMRKKNSDNIGIPDSTKEIKFNTIILDMGNIGCFGGVFLGGLALGYLMSRKR